MKKKYQRPTMEVDRAYVLANFLTVSGNFKEGETTSSGVHEGEIDGGDAWTKSDSWEIWE